MTEYINLTIDELRVIFNNKTREETFNFIIKILDNDNELAIDEIDLIHKICDLKNITIDEIEEYFELHESLKN